MDPVTLVFQAIGLAISYWMLYAACALIIVVVSITQQRSTWFAVFISIIAALIVVLHANPRIPQQHAAIAIATFVLGLLLVIISRRITRTVWPVH